MGTGPDVRTAVLKELERVAVQGLRHLGSTLLPADEICLSLVEAASAETVRAAFERAGLRIDRVTEALDVPATPDSETRQP